MEKSKFESLITDGTDNSIEVHPSANISKLRLKIVGNSNQVVIGASTIVGSISILGSSSKVIIGDKVSAQHIVAIVEEGKNLLIGDRCLFSWGISIRTSDSHSILDLNSGKRLNPAGNVVFENDVWVGQEVLVLKNTYVSQNSVIASRAVLNASYPSNCIVGGIPAKIIKDNIRWVREKL